MARGRSLFFSWAMAAGAIALAAAVFGWAWFGSSRPAGGQLPAVGAAISQTSVSGLSAGAYMAGQFQVAHSDIVVGAGLVAGGPYGCAESSFSRLWPIWTTAVPHNLNLALNACMDDSLAVMGKPDVETLAERTRELAQEGKIAPLSGLAADRLYLFHAADDDTVERSVVATAAQYYRAVGVADGNIAFVRYDRGAHAFITDDAGLECGVEGAPYLNDCGYDQAGAILKHIYPAAARPGETTRAEYRTFAQTRYVESGASHSLAAEGLVYVPRACRDEPGCAVHIVFHGCEQNREAVGDAFVRGSGFARWADANQIVVLFPQVRRSTVNPRACWDWWGYTGLNFRERSAPQIAAVRAMVARLAQQP